MSSFLYRFSPRGRLMASLVLLAAIVGTTAVQAYTIVPQRNVSEDGNNSVKPRVAQDPQGNVHVVWDSAEGGRKVMYSKGTWNGTSYDFTRKQLVADVGGFQYSAPNIFVAPNNQAMIAWSDGTLKVKTFDVNAGPPTGAGTPLGGGINPTVSADYSNNFHIVWDGDFQVQYCEFANNACVFRQSLDASEGSLRPDIAIDDTNNVHVLWEGDNEARYRTRVAGSGAPLGPTEDIGRGNFGGLAVDGTGAIHIVRSNEYNAVYCRKSLGGPCVDERKFDFAADLEPSVGASRGGTVLVVFRDDDNDVLVINALENGVWSTSKEFASSTTQVDLTQRTYASRFSVVWSRDFDIYHGGFATVALPCDTQTGTSAAPPAAPAESAPVAPAQFAYPLKFYLPTFEMAPITPPPPPDGC